MVVGVVVAGLDAVAGACVPAAPRPCSPGTLPSTGRHERETRECQVPPPIAKSTQYYTLKTSYKAVVAFHGSARQAAEAVDFACYVQLIPALPSAIASTSHTDAPASHCHGPNASGSIR